MAAHSFHFLNASNKLIPAKKERLKNNAYNPARYCKINETSHNKLPASCSFSITFS